MTCHFTYTPELNTKELFQGDLLKRDQRLDALLADIHPYYHKKKIFEYFMVLTQSCDLALRQGNCKARYITLAAVLPFKRIFDWEMSLYQNSKIQQLGGLIDIKNRGQAKNFVEKILNNNHPEFFYLHNDNRFGLKEPYCAILRLSVAIRSNQHYEDCLKAKFMQLDENFRAKLGWSVGQIFSRVGTQDWVPKPKAEPEFKQMIKDILDASYIWLDKNQMKIIEDDFRGNTDPDRTGIKQKAEQIKKQPKIKAKTIVIDAIQDILIKSGVINEGADIGKLIRKIESDPVVSAYLRE